jgi:hypothetical protein
MLVVEINGQRYELTGTTEVIARQVLKHAETINAIDEGRAEWLIWPDGGIEFNLTQMVDDNMRTENGREDLSPPSA